jgi:predicted transcriptional regulator
MSAVTISGMAEDRPADPTEQGQWRALRLMQSAMDDDIARIYDEAQISGVKTSWVMELLRLNARGPMTITELAESVQRTHSGTSQKVAAMRAAGLVRTTPGDDARTRKVTLQVVADMEAALRRKSFHDRIADKLAADPDWTGGAR